MNSAKREHAVNGLFKDEKRGVKIRIAVANPKKVKLFKFHNPKAYDFVNNPNFEARIISSEFGCKIFLCDNDKCIILTSIEPDAIMSPILHSTNPVQIELCRTYFEIVWNSSAKIEINKQF
jgi:hypothetical protein